MRRAWVGRVCGACLFLCGAALGFGQVAGGMLGEQIRALLAEPAVTRAHWGMMVTAMDGTPIFAMNEGQFFQPASNAKLFTTAAAMALLGAGSTFETRVVSNSKAVAGRVIGDLVIVGDGDANLSGRTLPYLAPALRPKITEHEIDPLHVLDELAEQIAASGVREIDGDIVGNDALFPWEPYAEDWVIDDMVWGYGAPVSALSIVDNQLKMTISPGALPKTNAVRGAEGPTKAVVNLEPNIEFYSIDNQIITTEAKSKTSIGIDRGVGSRTLRLFGTIAADASPDIEEIAIADPAEYAAMALKEKLVAHGVAVKGKAIARHRMSEDAQGFLDESRQPLVLAGSAVMSGVGPCLRCKIDRQAGAVTLASHRSPTVEEDVTVTNKVSQNLHAELLLHQLSVAFSDDVRAGSTEQGARVVRQFLLNVGVDKDDFVFYDGSGLSGHDLVTPRAIAKLLQFASTQPWFQDYKISLPIGGVDGYLEGRFNKAPLTGHVFAKTGTLGEARALSGYLDCASGKAVIFSVLVGNHAPGTSADKEVMDRIVAAIAAAN